MPPPIWPLFIFMIFLTLVYVNRPRDLKGLKANIRANISDIPADLLWTGNGLTQCMDSVRGVANLIWFFKTVKELYIFTYITQNKTFLITKLIYFNCFFIIFCTMYYFGLKLDYCIRYRKKAHLLLFWIICNLRK